MIVTGRTMDWVEPTQTDLWIFPRGMKRDGAAGENSVQWTSKYGSVIASMYRGATADGMNEKGLVANMLYLAESQYPPESDKRPGISISAWAQYALDQFATVEEAVNELKKETFKVVQITAPNGSAGTVHLSISDPSGDSAIFEYVEGKLTIHHGRQYQVMTNSPIYSEQLALNTYWEQIGGTVMLPGTNRAADRFARTSFYINACKQSSDPHESVASVFSVMRNASVPLGISTAGQPNIASTLWRTVSDQKNRVYFFENTLSPSLIWVKLADINFDAGSGVRKLAMEGKTELAGNQTGNFVPAEPFNFLSPSK